MDDPLYRDELLDLYHEAPHRGRLDRYDRAAERDNPLCGDSIRIEFALDPEGHIERIGFDGQGCVISQVAASLLAERLEGARLEDARGFEAEEMLELIGLPLTPSRVKCGLLAWKAFRDALNPTDDAPAEADSSPTLTP